MNNKNGQSQGYTLYETTITSGGLLKSGDNVRDRALVSDLSTATMECYSLVTMGSLYKPRSLHSHTHTHKCTQARAQTHMHVHTHTHLHTIDTFMHTHEHTHTHTHTHTHKHTHTLMHKRT